MRGACSTTPSLPIPSTGFCLRPPRSRPGFGGPHSAPQPTTLLKTSPGNDKFNPLGRQQPGAATGLNLRPIRPFAPCRSSSPFLCYFGNAFAVGSAPHGPPPPVVPAPDSCPAQWPTTARPTWMAVPPPPARTLSERAPPRNPSVRTDHVLSLCFYTVSPRLEPRQTPQGQPCHRPRSPPAT